MVSVPILDIVALVEGEYSGPTDLAVTAVNTLKDAAQDEITFLSNAKYTAQLQHTSAGAVLVSKQTSGSDPRWIRVADPYFAVSQVVSRWFARRPMPQGISRQASVSATAIIGDNVAIGAFARVGENVSIADDVVVFQGVSVEAGAQIGAGTIIYPNVVIYDGSIIGRRCVLHANTVVGSDGYGFATHRGKHHKIPQVGIVRIEDDVEIGAGTTIDRAAFGETVIGEGTKIDNLVQIGHNVKIGKHCLIVSQVGIAGSTELGDHVAVGGQSGLSGHLKIGNRVQIGGGTAVVEDTPDGSKVMGYPAVPFRQFARREAILKRLTEKGELEPKSE
ncbi:MAG TPA: UDP-3-O-(3-hydroxymyristoyl)glucosamine N-acyltransferase [Chthoniobacterales bacterium]|nr:UDP-3-O-(3-hydroxymyristoyl)glucosamine N-acyltransferase [Chthoniobacterales bacterium]